LLTASSEQVLAIVARALGPYLGTMMASASARGMAEKLGLLGKQLDREQMTLLLDTLGPGLTVFVGKDKQRLIVEEIWRALEALGEGAS
jgi:hypothetical protein